MDLINEITLPKNWSELIAIKKIIPFLTNKVTRFSENQQSYENSQKIIPREKLLQNILDEIGNQNIKITINNFPYSRLTQYITEVQQFVLWSKKGKLSSKIIETEIGKIFPNKDHFWFVNPPNNKSIPEIWHCHVFVKIK